MANDLCDVDFDEILDSNDMQKNWTQFKVVFLDIIEQCIPKAVLQRRNLPWLTKQVIQLIKSSRRATAIEVLTTVLSSGSCATM